MVPIEPEYRIADEKRPNLISSIIEYIRLPVGMKAFPHIRMFIQMSAVKTVQAMLITRKMRRNPVEDNPNIILMKFFHQEHQVLRCSITGSSCKVTTDLIAPGRIKG